MDDPISDGLNAAANVLNTEQARNLSCPATQEIGQMLGSLASVLRFCVEDNLEKLFPKWKRQRQNRPITPDELRKVIPLLQAASLVSDGDLQERWAALLESSVSGSEDVLPSFGQTLSQLTAEEARFLEQLYERRREMGDIWSLEWIYDPMLRHRFNDDEADKKRAHLRLMIQDFERLGLIVVEQSIENVRQPHSQYELASYLEKLGKRDIKSKYHFSDYGVSFIKAVTPKK